jgi:hypothetical protein
MELARVKTEAFVPRGGLDIVSPPMTLAPGVAFDAENWECSLEAGVSVIGGYDKYVDGDTAGEMMIRPAIFSVLTGSLISGEILRGATSGATLVFGITADQRASLTAGMTNVGVFVTNVSGQFIAGEALLRADSLSPSTIYLESVPDGFTGTAEEVEEQRADAESAIRRFMDKPGSGEFAYSALNSGLTQGPLLGAFVMDDIPYAVRAKNPALTSTGATNAVFIRPARGPQSNRYWEVAADMSAIPTAGADFKFVLSNFANPALPPVCYGVSGTYQAFMYDGSSFTFLPTGMSIDRPSHLAVHENRLFLAFEGSLQFSALNDPTTWSVVVGAGEIATGSKITGLLSVTGSEGASALLVSTETRLFVLYGSAVDEFRLIQLSENTGALPKSIQWIGQPVFQNMFGITMLSTSDRYGGFEESAISSAVKPFLDERRSRATASMICRDKNQYRLFFDDKTALYVTFKDGKVLGMFRVRLKHKVTCAWSSKLSNQTELMLIGTEDGGLYKMDVGTSFAGESIPHFIRFAFNHIRSPRVEKHFKRALIEAEADGYCRVHVGYDLDYGGNRREVTADEAIETPGLNGGFWDDGTWDVGYWDGATTTPFVVDTPGSGVNYSLRFQNDDRLSKPLNITGVLVDYTVRRQQRGH